MRRVQIDHVIWAAHDLDAATARFEAELGVAATGGGRHEGHGTINRILPLGGGYLEVLGVADAAEAAGSDFGSGLVRRLDTAGDGWLAWVVAVPDVEPVAERLGTRVTVLRREGLSARLTGVAQAMDAPTLPFFVSRDPGVADPGAGGDAGGIARLELGGDAARLASWLGHASLPVQVTEGPPALRGVAVGGRVLR